jgi:hypothetical protein
MRSAAPSARKYHSPTWPISAACSTRAAHGKDTIRKWEDGDGPTGPVSAMVRLILEGVTHTNPDVSGFFINYVRERPRDVPF